MVYIGISKLHFQAMRFVAMIKTMVSLWVHDMLGFHNSFCVIFKLIFACNITNSHSHN